MRALVYMVGEPGSGKTTLMKALNAHRDATERTDRVPRIEWAGADTLPDPYVELGRNRDSFGGTDALAMNIQPAALEWMGDTDGLIIAEGDRLGNARFFAAAEGLGWRTLLVWVKTSPELAAARREARGGGQNETWLRGRATKVARLVDNWLGELVTIDGTRSPEHNASTLRDEVAAWLR